MGGECRANLHTAREQKCLQIQYAPKKNVHSKYCFCPENIAKTAVQTGIASS